MTANNERADWWKQAVVYQVYPRSFKDSDGDGLGDIAGVSEKMDYLRALGVDAVWLSPFYPSELADGGYDVIDYRDVDPRLGTMDDFDEMTLRAHEAGIKVIVDIVPAVGELARIEGAEPNRVDAQLPQIGDPPGDAIDVAQTGAGGVLEALWVNLVDDGVAPPVIVGESHIVPLSDCSVRMVLPVWPHETLFRRPYPTSSCLRISP